MTHLLQNNQSVLPAVPELLSPAGDHASLLAALSSKANAVYLGTEDFNARRGAPNFSLEELREACDLAHLAAARVYLTLNTAVLTSEFEAALELARQAWYAGVDAAIVSDLGLLATLAKELPELELHASTQLNTHNTASLQWLAKLGVARVTLARELAVEQIAALALAGVPLEVFVHGALCFCYSGQCLLSSLVGRRSANRGLCAQPCRLPYRLINTSTGRQIATPGDRLLSPLDLNAIELVDKLKAAGVAALKIEGRKKNADYVAAVTQVYRQVLDAGKLKEDADGGAGAGAAAAGSADTNTTHADILKNSYSRGFTEAYLKGERGNAMMSYGRSTGRSANSGDSSPVWNTDALFQANRGFVSLHAEVQARVGQPLALRFTDKRSGLSAQALGPIIQPAHSRPLLREDLIEHVGRVGATPFSIASWEIALDQGAAVRFSDLHGTRKEALRSLQLLLLEPWHSRRLRRSDIRNHEQLPAARRGAPFVAALVRDKLAVKAARKAGAERIYMHTLAFSNDAEGVGKHDTGREAASPNKRFSETFNAAPWLPTITDDDQLQTLRANILLHLQTSSASAGASAGTNPKADAKHMPIMVNNLGELALAKELNIAFEVGPALGCYNQASLELFCQSGASRVWLGPELSLHDLQELAPTSPVPLGLTIMGAQELMVSEHCILMAEGDCDRKCGSCSRRKAARLLEDRKGYRFPLHTDHNGRSHLYNAVSLDIVAQLPELLSLGITGFLVDATLLNNSQISDAVARAARACRLATQGTGSLPKREGCTTGHLYRGVL